MMVTHWDERSVHIQIDGWRSYLARYAEWQTGSLCVKIVWRVPAFLILFQASMN